MNPLANPEDLDEATRVINQYAISDWLKLSLSDHAQDQLEARIFPHDVMMDTLATGVCVGVRSEVVRGNLRYGYEMEMRDQWGRVTVVTAIPGSHRLRIITLYTDIKD